VTASAKVEMTGVKDAIRLLNKIEPNLRKEFQQEAARIAQPAIQEAQRNYVGLPLSGMARQWASKGRKLFPYDPNKAAKGVKLKLDTSRKAMSVIVVQQTNVAAAVFETAGRKNPNSLGDQLGKLLPGRTRILGPSVYRKRREIEQEMRQAVMQVIKTVNKELS
jgi:hypothetical protein